MKKNSTATRRSFIFFFAIIILRTSQSLSQVCSDPLNVVYGLTNSGFIYPINVNTGSVGTVLNPAYTGNAPSASNAIGYNSVNGNFYYFKRDYPANPQEFVSFNPSTNAYTILASSPVTGVVYSGCVSFDGTGYYCLDTNGNLCYYDIASNTWTLITSVYVDGNGNNITSTFTSNPSGDIAIDGLGNIWVVCSSSSQYAVFKIPAPLPRNSVASVAITLIKPLAPTPTGSLFAGIGFSSTGQIYMSTSNGDNQLYRLETNLTLTHMSTFSLNGVGADLTSCNFPFTMLPVSWENFNVTLQNNNSVSISWEVSQQINNKGYYVQRSADGANWNQLGFVGNNATLKTSEQYSFNDNNPYNGINYYRVSQVDLDSNTDYSEIKSITIKNAASSHVSVWPNPAKDVISIQNNNDANDIARIYNQSGALVIESKLHSGINTVNVSSLSFGAYIISLKTTNGENYNQKFIKQ